MIMPSKIIQPVDSLISIAAYVIEILHKSPMCIDDLFVEVNISYYKSISIEKLILCLDFLFIINKIKDDDEIITVII